MRDSPTNNKRYRDAALCGLAMGTAIGTSIAITQRMARHHRMPNLKTWQRALIEKHGEVQGTILAARMQARYEALYQERPQFTHPALRWHLEQNILPGLALYQVLREENNERDAALAETGSLLAIGLTSRALTNLVNMRKYLPLPFAIFGQILRVSLLAYPQQGWDIEQIEESKTSFAFNIHRCFYLDVLTAYGAPELTAMFCRLDDLAYAALSPSIKWERTKTLGRGDACCDFRWSRVELARAASGLIQVGTRARGRERAFLKKRRQTMKTTSSAPVVVLPQPPRKGPLWLWFQFFPLLYRLHLGWLLGHRRLLLTHQGRKTGQLRHTALDVMRYDRATKECLVISMYGERADWFRNIMAHPALEVQTGRDRFVPEQRILPPEEARAVLSAFWQRYPRAVRLSLRLLGFQYEDTEESRQVILSALRVVSFRPRASSQARDDALEGGDQ